jgi:hypothetical protein
MPQSEGALLKQSAWRSDERGATYMPKRKALPQPETPYDEILANTPITEDGPGPLLHDFQVLLDFVTENSIQLTDALKLPMKALAPLNERLTRRIEHRLARAQQKSYPHISGLYLLLRASGLTLVDQSGRKPVLVVDPPVLESWQSLSSEERYFALLESWLLRGDSALIGEDRSGFFSWHSQLREWATFFQMLEKDEWHEADWMERVRYWPGTHNLGLMELFGLVAIDDAPPQPQKGWQIADVRATAWGDALLVLLFTQLIDKRKDFWVMFERPQDIPPGILQPYIQPYRPAWQQTLQLPEKGFQDGLFVFKVSLDKDLWRMINIPAQSTLEDLSDAILEAYRFDHDHLYRFLYASRFGFTEEVVHPYMEQSPDTTEVRIGDLTAEPGFKMIYNYDFGDDWNFDVHLERIDPPNPKVKAYQIGKRLGKSPEQYPSWDDDELDDDDD